MSQRSLNHVFIMFGRNVSTQTKPFVIPRNTIRLTVWRRCTWL